MNGHTVVEIKEHEHMHGCCTRRRISWSAILVGTLTGIGLSFILHLFNIAIGLTVFNMTDAGTSLAIGGLIGMIIGIIVSMFIAGFVAGFLGSFYCYPNNFGVIYGFTTWSLILLFTVFFSMHMSQYATAYSNNISNPVAVVAIADNNAPAISTAPGGMAKPAAVVVNQAKMPSLATTTFLVFILMILGALASCFGGYSGMCHCKDRYCV